jgi:hypothetical protein
MKFKEKVFVVYLLILQILLIYRGFLLEGFDIFFYFCDHICVVLALCFVFGWVDFIKALINVGLIVQIFWVVNVLVRFFFGFFLFGVRIFIFESSNYFSIVLSLLIHFSSLIVAFLFVRKKRTNFVSVLYAELYFLILYVLTLFFTNPINDVNCVFSACGLSFFQFDFFYFFYLPIVFVLVVFPSFLLQRLFEKF